MLNRLVRALCLLLVPALLLLGGARGAYALFECTMMQTVQAHCCCPGKAGGVAAGNVEQSEPCPAQVERADCCNERWVDAQAPVQGHELPSVAPAVLAASYTRVLVRELYALASQPSFAVREAPRAIGPPLILLHRVLRL